MSKAIFLTGGDHPFNQVTATHLLEQGHHLTMHFQTQDELARFQSAVAPEHAERLHAVHDAELSDVTIRSTVEAAIEVMGGVDVFIHGDEHVDEELLFDTDPLAFGQFITQQFQQIFRFNREVSAHMVRRKAGTILFPIFFDTLYYDGYPSSPVLNHGKRSLMKCMSRELCAFNLSVNVVTFGYYDAGYDRQEKKAKKETLEIYGLKPTLLKVEEMVKALDIFINPVVKNMGGQDLFISSGIETIL